MKTKKSLKQVMALGVCTVALATAVPAITPVKAYAVSYSYEFTTPKYTERNISIRIITSDTRHTVCVLPIGFNQADYPSVKVTGLDQSPVIINDRTFVPMRAVFEALGCQVGWEGDTKTVTVNKDGVEVTLVIGNSTMQVNKNGQVSSVALDAAPVIINGRTLLPLRAPAEAFGYSVEWDPETSSGFGTSYDGGIFIRDAEKNAEHEKLEEEQRRREEEQRRQEEESKAFQAKVEKGLTRLAEYEKQYKASSKSLTNAEYAQEVLKCMNMFREELGLPAYTMDSTLQAGAQIRAQECATVFNHIRPNGLFPETAVSDTSAYAGIAENLAKRIPGTDSPAEFVVGWLNSEAGHGAQVISTSSTIVGVGIYNSGDQVYCAAFFTHPKN